MCGIYKITNNINGKIYIGQSHYIEARWESHKRNAFYKNSSSYDFALYRAMRKYGIENFSFEIIEECQSEELNKREKYWIDFYNSYKQGYNMTLGGEGNLKIDYNQVLNLWKQGFSAGEISNALNINPSTLTYILKYLNIPSKEIHKRQALIMSKPVKQYTLDGVYIATYKSAQEASEKYNITARNIQSVCLRINQYKSAGGFIWKYANDNTPIDVWVDRKKVLDSPQKKKVYQYNLNMELINIYESTGEASKQTNIKQQNISSYCRGKRNTAGGFIWRYDEN